MRYLFFTFLLFVGVYEGYSQAQSALPSTIRATNTLEGLHDFNGLGGGEVLYGIPIPEGTVKGDFYLNTNWRITTLLLYEKDKLLEGFPSRYDINANELEVKAKNGIRVIKGDKIKSFIWMDSLTRTPTYFLNSKEYSNEEGVQLSGFFQLLSDGSKPLFKKTGISIKKASYKVQFDVGSRDTKILKKHEYYTVQDSNRVVDVPSSQKKLLLLFGDDAPAVKKFIKANSLTIREEHHLKAIFDHYNSLARN